MRIRTHLRCLALAVWLAGVCVSAQTPAPIVRPTAADPVLDDAQRWIGRALILRSFHTAAELDFDAAGHAKGSPKTVDWTLAGVDLDKITRRETGELQLEGWRVFISYNTNAHTFDRHPRKDEHLKILLPAPADHQALNAEMAAIFSQGIDLPLMRSLPPYWLHYFIPAAEWPGDELKGTTILGLDGKVPAELVPAAAEKKVEPDLTPEGRQARVKATAQFTLVVDAEGAVHHITIRQPIGYGLDEKTAEAVAKWRFKPAVLAGKPVAVQVTVSQGFDLTAPTNP